jgi:hypothetical protein
MAGSVQFAACGALRPRLVADRPPCPDSFTGAYRSAAFAVETDIRRGAGHRRPGALAAVRRYSDGVESVGSVGALRRSVLRTRRPLRQASKEGGRGMVSMAAWQHGLRSVAAAWECSWERGNGWSLRRSIPHVKHIKAEGLLLLPQTTTSTSLPDRLSVSSADRLAD